MPVGGIVWHGKLPRIFYPQITMRQSSKKMMMMIMLILLFCIFFSGVLSDEVKRSTITFAWCILYKILFYLLVSYCEHVEMSKMMSSLWFCMRMTLKIISEKKKVPVTENSIFSGVLTIFENKLTCLRVHLIQVYIMYFFKYFAMITWKSYWNGRCIPATIYTDE